MFSDPERPAIVGAPTLQAASTDGRHRRALMSSPRLLLCDEISLGLAPIVVADLYAALPSDRLGAPASYALEQDIVRR